MGADSEGSASRPSTSGRKAEPASKPAIDSTVALCSYHHWPSRRNNYLLFRTGSCHTTRSVPLSSFFPFLLDHTRVLGTVVHKPDTDTRSPRPAMPSALTKIPGVEYRTPQPQPDPPCMCPQSLMIRSTAAKSESATGAASKHEFLQSFGRVDLYDLRCNRPWF